MKRINILSGLVSFLPLLLMSCGSPGVKGPALITEEKCDGISAILDELEDEGYEGVPARIEELLGTPPTDVKSNTEVNAEIYIWEDSQSGVEVVLNRNIDGEFAAHGMRCNPSGPL